MVGGGADKKTARTSHKPGISGAKNGERGPGEGVCKRRKAAKLATDRPGKPAMGRLCGGVGKPIEKQTMVVYAAGVVFYRSTKRLRKRIGKADQLR